MQSDPMGWSPSQHRRPVARCVSVLALAVGAAVPSPVCISAGVRELCAFSYPLRWDPHSSRSTIPESNG